MIAAAAVFAGTAVAGILVLTAALAMPRSHTSRGRGLAPEALAP